MLVRHSVRPWHVPGNLRLGPNRLYWLSTRGAFLGRREYRWGPHSGDVVYRTHIV